MRLFRPQQGVVRLFVLRVGRRPRLRLPVRFTAVGVLLVVTACVHAPTPLPHTAALECGDGSVMRVHFYDVGQALAVLIELPNGQLVLVDTGESPTRAGCGRPCRDWHEHLMSELRHDVGDRAIDLLWVTHPHSDHIGGALDVIEAFKVALYADNGTLRANKTVQNTLAALEAKGVRVELTEPVTPASSLQQSAALRVRGILPSSWPSNCDKDPNNCCAGLRIDYCQSSVLLMGVADKKDEAALEIGDHVGVLQVGHHGSDTSSSEGFLDQVSPQWAVVSSGKRDEGTNRTYCHPRASTVARMSSHLGALGGPPIEAFGGKSCGSGQEGWASTATSSHLFFTARDGDVVLATNGDGVFKRE